VAWLTNAGALIAVSTSSQYGFADPTAKFNAVVIAVKISAPQQ
jgi:hypothetical protein